MSIDRQLVREKIISQRQRKQWQQRLGKGSWV
jgi:hypothetical protein